MPTPAASSITDRMRRDRSARSIRSCDPRFAASDDVTSSCMNRVHTLVKFVMEGRGWLFRTNEWMVPSTCTDYGVHTVCRQKNFSRETRHCFGRIPVSFHFSAVRTCTIVKELYNDDGARHGLTRLSPRSAPSTACAC